MLASCDHSIVASRTSAEHLRMIHHDHGCPYIRGMAIFADVRRLDMARPFTSRTGAIVAVGTVPRDGGVIEGCRQPGSRRVAVIASGTACNMGRMFSCRRIAIMTRNAIAEDLDMINV